MYLAGFSINILTLLGIVLATGLVVDDAIVVLENIYQKIEQGMSPHREAAFKGSQQIFLPSSPLQCNTCSSIFTYHVFAGLDGKIV